MHVHALVLDGVFARDSAGAVAFHPASPLSALDVAEVLATIEPRIKGLLDRRGRGERDEAAAPDAWEDTSPALAGQAAASVEGTVTTGCQRGTRIRRVGQPPEMVDLSEPRRCHARSNGFDLHAGLVVPAGQSDRLKRVCRYALRPPVPGDRLSTTGDGRVMLQLRHRWADGTTHLVFDPVEFLGRLAVLVPRPRVNLMLYHGVLGPRAAWRAEIVRGATSAPRAEGEAMAAETPGDQAGSDDPADGARRHARGQCWAALMRRTFGVDPIQARRGTSSRRTLSRTSPTISFPGC